MREKETGSTARRLPGPAGCRLGDGRAISRRLLRIVSGLAENTNSIIGDGPSGPETANGCPVLRERRNLCREAHVRAAGSGICVLRAPPKRASGELRFLLTKDLHGSRQSGNWAGLGTGSRLVSADPPPLSRALNFRVPARVGDHRGCIAPLMLVAGRIRLCRMVHFSDRLSRNRRPPGRRRWRRPIRAYW